jgi:D-tyrosyl-tRNA(Tyr) deacylase
MRAVVQRVSKASVSIEEKIVGKIGIGLCAFIAISSADDDETMKWMCNKLVNLRIFPDEERKMNKSLIDCNGGILLISNFTLYGDLRKGFRPSFIDAAPPEIAQPLYERMINYLEENYPLQIAAGVFGAMMDIELVNNGPVTIIIEK